MIKVICNYPSDMSILQEKMSETLADIIAKKLSSSELRKLIEALEHDPECISL